ncbi:hypothetical protein FUAX_51010 (plasmid) [Fulvitalea axinellae]|uniref:Leucine-rich repeat domain-containing protein n=1 Tax=Fulvitalea axinellae TaxID=1182444 RepID=A0AAU9D248_9BACT|nr:hypothetical protein FUAX_51010 [Fulvitalea axinellae]
MATKKGNNDIISIGKDLQQDAVSASVFENDSPEKILSEFALAFQKKDTEAVMELSEKYLTKKALGREKETADALLQMYREGNGFVKLNILDIEDIFILVDGVYGNVLRLLFEQFQCMDITFHSLEFLAVTQFFPNVTDLILEPNYEGYDPDTVFHTDYIFKPGRFKRLYIKGIFVPNDEVDFSLFNNLEELKLEATGIQYPKFGQHPYLQKISVTDSKIENFPESLVTQKGLREIYLNAENLKSIPYSFTNLSDLRELDIRTSENFKSPRWLSQMQNLSVLGIKKAKEDASENTKEQPDSIGICDPDPEKQAKALQNINSGETCHKWQYQILALSKVSSDRFIRQRATRLLSLHCLDDKIDTVLEDKRTLLKQFQKNVRITNVFDGLEDPKTISQCLQYAYEITQEKMILKLKKEVELFG